MKTPYEYRAQARTLLQNRWGEAVIASAIIFGLALLISTPSVAGSLKASLSGETYGTMTTTLLALLVVPLQYALYTTLLLFTRDESTSLLQTLKQHCLQNYGRFFVAGMLVTLLSSIVGVFTLGIGAVIMSYMYRMVPYLLHDYPELSAREAMKISRQMMSGHKWELLLLDLSFLPWILLSIITLGLGTLLLVPYMQTANALYYEDLKANTIVETDDNAAEVAEEAEGVEEVEN